MNHDFKQTLLSKDVCTLCERDFTSHTNLAECDGCGVATTCNIFGSLTNRRAPLLCNTCTQAERDKNSVVVAATEKSIVELAKQVDGSIRYNGDVFNSKILALEDVRLSIMQDESIPSEQRSFKFQEYLASRYAHLKGVVFDLDNKKFEAVTEQQVIQKSLRELANDLHKDIAAKIKETDSNYIPTKVKSSVKPKIAKITTKDPREKLLQMIMGMDNCSREEAMAQLEKGKK